MPAGQVLVFIEVTALEQWRLHGSEIAGGDGALFDELMVLIGVAVDEDRGEAFGACERKKVDEARRVDTMLRLDSFENSCVERLTLRNGVIVWRNCEVDGYGRRREAGLHGEHVDIAVEEEPCTREKDNDERDLCSDEHAAQMTTVGDETSCAGA